LLARFLSGRHKSPTVYQSGTSVLDHRSGELLALSAKHAPKCRFPEGAFVSGFGGLFVRPSSGDQKALRRQGGKNEAAGAADAARVLTEGGGASRLEL
ncbi:MAG TPA: hypothetical protein VFE29_04340, partial [Terriglobia bacterium]|nr:hypothetical protein [Terriglobia bacterium]